MFRSAVAEYSHLYPKHWKSIPIIALCENRFGGGWGKDEKNEKTPHEISIVRVVDFDHHTLSVDIREERFSRRYFKNLPHKENFLRKGDVLLEQSGTPGRVAMIMHHPKMMTINSNFTTALRVRSEIIMPRYFTYACHFLCVTGIIQKHIKTNTYQNLFKPTWMMEKIPIPPLDEQAYLMNSLDQYYIKAKETMESAHDVIKLCQETSDAAVYQALTMGQL